MKGADGFDAAAKKINDVAEKVERSSIGGNSTSGVHFHGSAGLSVIAIIAIVVGVTAIIAAIAAVLVVSAYRDADMQELRALSTQSDMNAAMITAHERRITKIEATPK